MFEEIKKIKALTALANKLADLVANIQKLDADKDGIPDSEEFKQLVPLALKQADDLKKTMAEISELLGADIGELREELGL